MTLPPRPPAWLVALVCAVLAAATAVLAPPVLWEKLGELVAAIAADPGGALTIAGTLGAMAAAFRAAWMRKPPSDPPSTPPSDSDGPPTTPRRRPTLPPDRIERRDVSPQNAPVPHGYPLVGLDVDPLTSPLLFTLLGPACGLRSRWRAAFWRGFREGYVRFWPLKLVVIAVLVAIALTGCGASALRTHSTIATVARVSVVTAGEAIARTCEVALSRCTDEACIERTSADCTVAGTAAEAAIDGVRAYVDVIEVAALADEGQVAASLDLAVQAMARLYNALRDALASLPSLGVTLPPLPPIAIAVLRALVAEVTS